MFDICWDADYSHVHAGRENISFPMNTPNIPILTDKHFESLLNVCNNRTKQLITMLGWAAEHNIPFEEILDSIGKKKKAYIAASNELKRGLGLGVAVEHLRCDLPDHYISAVKHAEKNKRLKEVLPSLAKNAVIMSIMFRTVKAILFAPLVELCVVFIFLFTMLPIIISHFSPLMKYSIIGSNQIHKIVTSMELSTIYTYAIANGPFVIAMAGGGIILLGSTLFYHKLSNFALNKAGGFRILQKKPLILCLCATLGGIVPLLSLYVISLWMGEKLFKLNIDSAAGIIIFMMVVPFFVASVIFETCLKKLDDQSTFSTLGFIFLWLLPILLVFILPLLPIFIFYRLFYYYGDGYGFISKSSPGFFLVSAGISAFYLAILFISYTIGKNPGKPLVLRLPWLGKMTRDSGQLELAMCMSVMMTAGDDIIQAAENSISICHWKWQKKKLQKCILDMQNGIPWDIAWEHMNISGPMELFIIHNAAAREDVIGGLNFLCEHLINKTGRRFSRLAVVLKMSILMGLSLFAGMGILFLAKIIFSITIFYCEKWNYY
jgi:type II secretory pathway component PulF